MSGYDDAKRWLKENGDEWVIRYAEASLDAGPTIGAPTVEKVFVTLSPTAEFRRPERYGWNVELRGEGATHLAAVQRAIGAYKA